MVNTYSFRPLALCLLVYTDLQGHHHRPHQRFEVADQLELFQASLGQLMSDDPCSEINHIQFQVDYLHHPRIFPKHLLFFSPILSNKPMNSVFFINGIRIQTENI